MSWETYDDNCKGCRPAIINAKTGRPLPDDSHEMRAVMDMWKSTTRQERIAFHRFTCLNSRDPHVMAIVASLRRRIEAALKTPV